MADRKTGLSSFSGEEQDAFQLGVSVAQITDVGRLRPTNQDHHLVFLLEGGIDSRQGEPTHFEIANGHLLVALADGMGGHFGGEVASALCIEALARELVNRVYYPAAVFPDLPVALRTAVEAANRAIFDHAQSYAEKVTMGTTLTAALLHGTRVDVAQVGDSRAYLFREGNLILLTQDQTVANLLRSQGEDLSGLDVRVHEMLVQAMGAQEEIDVIMTAVDLEPGDHLLFCCDGLHKVVPPKEIAETLELEMDLPERVARLVARANEYGGPDNITAILAEIRQAASTS